MIFLGMFGVLLAISGFGLFMLDSKDREKSLFYGIFGLIIAVFAYHSETTIKVQLEQRAATGDRQAQRTICDTRYEGEYRNCLESRFPDHPDLTISPMLGGE